MNNSTSKKLIILVFLSIILGIYIPFFFVFVNAEFLRLIDPKYLPFAFILGGIGGLSFAKLFELIEKNLPIKTSLILFSSLISFVLMTIWGLYNLTDVPKNILVFLLYSWFWISSSKVIMIFWKIPTLIFDLSENKKYNSFISIGEVVSAILVYLLIIPLIENFNLFERETFLLISFTSLFIFSAVIYGLNFENKNKAVNSKKELENKGLSLYNLFKNGLFKYLFISVIIVTFIQLIVDFSLMNIVNDKRSYLNFSLASFFSVVYGSMRILELIFKVFVAKKIMNQYGVLGGFYAMIFAIGLIYCIGLLIHNAGDSSAVVIMILAVAAMGKVMERSINRSIYLPSQNVLFQAFEKDNKSIIQSYITGLGVPIGLISSGLLMVVLFLFDTYFYKILFLFMCIIASNYIWLIVSKRLKNSYYKQLEVICKNMKSFKIVDLTKGAPKFNQAVQSKSNLSDFLNKISSLKNLSNDNLINEMILFNSYLNSNINFISEVKLDDKLKLNEFVTILNYHKIDITFYQSLSFLIIANLDYEEITKILENNSSSSLKNLIYNFESALDNEVKNFNLLSEKVLLVKTIYYTRLYQKNPKDFFNSINYENSSNKYRILQFLILTKNIILKESVLYQTALRQSIENYCVVLNLINSLDGDKSLRILLDSLRDESLFKLKVIFSILALKYDGKLIFNIEVMIIEGNKESLTLGTEMLELNLDEHDFELVSPILKFQSVNKILKSLETEFPQPVYSSDDALKAIILFYKNIISDLTQNLSLYYLIQNSKSLQDDEYFTRFLFGDVILMEQFNLNKDKFHEKSIPYKLKNSQRKVLSQLMPKIIEIAKDFLDKKLPITDFKSYFLTYNQ